MGLAVLSKKGLGLRAEFLEACGRYHVPIFNYPAEELAAELRADLEAVRQASS